MLRLEPIVDEFDRTIDCTRKSSRERLGCSKQTTTRRYLYAAGCDLALIWERNDRARVICRQATNALRAASWEFKLCFVCVIASPLAGLPKRKVNFALHALEKFLRLGSLRRFFFI